MIDLTKHKRAVDDFVRDYIFRGPLKRYASLATLCLVNKDGEKVSLDHPNAYAASVAPTDSFVISVSCYKQPPEDIQRQTSNAFTEYVREHFGSTFDLPIRYELADIRGGI